MRLGLAYLELGLAFQFKTANKFGLYLKLHIKGSTGRWSRPTSVDHACSPLVINQGSFWPISMKLELWVDINIDQSLSKC